MVVSESFQHTALSGSQFKATGFTGGYLLSFPLAIKRWQA
jgi:hypothetical protein